MNKPISCQSCPIGAESSGFSLPHGNSTNGVVIVGDCLSHGDYQEGKVFTPNTGEGGKLAGTIRQAGASPNQFAYTSIISCMPPHGGLLAGMLYEAPAMANCAKHLEMGLNRVQTPHRRVLLALGDVAIRGLSGFTGSDKDKQGMKYLRGYIIESQYGPVIFSYHPRQLLAGNQHLTPCLEADIRKAMAYAGRRWNPSDDLALKDYDTFPSLDQAMSYFHMLRDNRNHCLTYDIETAQASGLEEDERDKGLVSSAEITQIQFSHRKHFGIVFPWKYPYIDVAKRILALDMPKAGSNCWNFDNKVLEANSASIAGTNHDIMWMFKTWQPKLSRMLQAMASFFDFPFAWKHLFDSDIGLYGCADVDAPQYILEKLPKLMRDFGCWDIYNRHVRQNYTIALKPASDRGIPVSAARHAELVTKLERRQQELMIEATLMIPEEIIPVTPRRKLADGTIEWGYKKPPKPLVELAKAWTEAKSRGKKMRYATFTEAAKMRLGLIRRGGAWCKLGEFSPNSSKQIMAYLNWQKAALLEAGEKEEAKLYEIPTVIKKGVEKQTTGKDALAVIVAKTDDKVLSMVLEARSIGKLLSNDLPNWIPASDGCVHTEWHFGPPTGQMGSRTPNVLNASKHTEIGQLFRRIIEAP